MERKGYVMNRRVVGVIKDKDGNESRYDFKRMGEVTVTAGGIQTPKYVECVYTKLPDAIKAEATLVTYDDSAKKAYINKNGEKFNVRDIKIISDTTAYMQENKQDEKPGK